MTCVRKKARQVPEQRLSGILLETVPQDDRGIIPHLAHWTCHCICWCLQNMLSVQLMHVKKFTKFDGKRRYKLHLSILLT